jgi:hypothetical protein
VRAASLIHLPQTADRERTVPGRLFARDRRVFVEDPIVVTRGFADEHVREHLLGHVRAAGVADEISAELAAADAAETAC